MKRNRRKKWQLPPRLRRRLKLLFARRGEEEFFIVFAVLTGILAGAAAAAIRWTMRLCEWGAQRCVDSTGAHWLLPLPLFAVLAGFGVKYLLHGNNSSQDMALLIRAVLRHNPKLVKLDTVSHILASPVTIALGGSAGLSTPGVLAGASLGGKLGTFLKLAPAQQARLMACGTAGGIAGVFDSPVSGVLFAMEVLMTHTGGGRLIPLLLSSAGAAVVSQLSFGEHPAFTLTATAWRAAELPYFVVFGVFASVVGVYMVRVNRMIEDFTRSGRMPMSGLLFAGGLLLAILLDCIGPLNGLGGEAMQRVFDGRAGELTGGVVFLRYLPEWSRVIALAFTLMLFKIVASGITLTCGGSGGYFTPALFTGVFAGLFFGMLRGAGGEMAANYAALGMCGVFASSFRAPLTGIFLVLELSGGYVLMIPLIVTGAVSYFLGCLLERDSLYLRAGDLPVPRRAGTRTAALKAAVPGETPEERNQNASAPRGG